MASGFAAQPPSRSAYQAPVSLAYLIVYPLGTLSKWLKRKPDYGSASSPNYGSSSCSSAVHKTARQRK
jgi:hypothetical protein